MPDAPTPTDFATLFQAHRGIAAQVAGSVPGRLLHIDYGAPVLQIQRRIARTRRWYVGSGVVCGLSWRLPWVPVLTLERGSRCGAVSAQMSFAAWRGAKSERWCEVRAFRPRMTDNGRRFPNSAPQCRPSISS
ncbi:hypothetical protein ACFOPN_07845 [Xanthomonas hyacinthi]|uniref:hypothetical protein n=1 Tax=Xanthomonas hyacinthi TaxID=56455 RepID=UPI0006598756|nr:hypothetical protein [Xanthomonas hyacinthi]KLD77492.1 hypothetical protein Y886_15425 [Xanthomonas hyacinthi DSM 19077]